MLTKEQILSVQDLETVEVNVPEWGGVVKVRTLSGTDMGKWRQIVFNKQEENRIVDSDALLCALSIVDDNNKKIFSEVDVIALSSKSSTAIDRITEVIQKLNKMSAKAVEELEKNSEAIHLEDSASS
jgi:hypothetical protein